jgi:hypothetical protein
MKKSALFLFTIAFIFTGSVNAQIKKGSVFLGGNIGASTQKTESNGTTVNTMKGVTIAPVFGKAIRENLVLGADIGFGLFKSKNSAQGSPSSSDQQSNSYAAGFFIRQYKSIAKSDFYIFLQGNAGINYASNKYNTPPTFFDIRKRYTISVSAYPGISYTISKRLQLETGFSNLLSLNYFMENREVTGSSPYTEKTSGINIASSLTNLSSLYLGFRVLINK